MGTPPFGRREGEGHRDCGDLPVRTPLGTLGGLMEQEGPPYGDTPGDTGGLMEQEGPSYRDAPGDTGG